MPIKEEPVIINLVYDPDERVNIPYHFKFETIDNVPYLDICMSDRDQHAYRVHMDVIIDVVDNLRAKGVISKGCLQSVLPAAQVTRTPGIHIPTVIKKDRQGFHPSGYTVGNITEVVAEQVFIEAEPFNSFSPTEVIKQAVVVAQAQAEVAIPAQNVSSAPEGIVQRPVIRSRVTSDDDPLGAEREASSLRKKPDEDKVIKRA
jgi:hypothetical protein